MSTLVFHDKDVIGSFQSQGVLDPWSFQDVLNIAHTHTYTHKHIQSDNL